MDKRECCFLHLGHVFIDCRAHNFVCECKYLRQFDNVEFKVHSRWHSDIKFFYLLTYDDHRNAFLCATQIYSQNTRATEDVRCIPKTCRSHKIIISAQFLI